MLVIFIASYLIGSIPFGYLIARLWKIDIRQAGSGNIGATNVLRTLGPIPGSIVFTLDLLKGALPIFLAQRITSDPRLIILAGLCVIIGHMFSVFMKFKGGKGAATGLGVLLGIAPDIFLGAVILTALIIGLTRYVSVASIIMSILITAAFYFLNRPLPYTIVAATVAVLVIIRHGPNIKRLISGTEPKIGDKK
ncbi:glycerol-3-phosphate 1-O-acyltransferase PlsY [Candidatus Margulisiibacteriota bacterium]